MPQSGYRVARAATRQLLTLLSMLVLLAVGNCFAQFMPFPDSLPLAGGIPGFEKYYRENFKYFIVRLWYFDNQERIQDFPVVEFDKTKETFEEFVPRTLKEKLKILETISPTNANREIRLVYHFLTDQAFYTHIGWTNFHLLQNGSAYSAPPGIAENWVKRSYTSTVGVYVPVLRRALLNVRDRQTGTVLFQGFTTWWTPLDDSNQDWNIDVRCYLVMPSKYFQEPHAGTLKVWNANGGQATYDLETGLRVNAPGIDVMASWPGVHTVRVTGDPGQTVELTEWARNGSVVQKHRLTLNELGISRFDHTNTYGLFQAKFAE